LGSTVGVDNQTRAILRHAKSESKKPNLHSSMAKETKETFSGKTKDQTFDVVEIIAGTGNIEQLPDQY
jgi:hypothetical protein